MLLTTLQDRVETATGGAVRALHAVDYDGDGVQDVVGVVDQTNASGSGTLSLWHGLGDGTFAVPVSLDVTNILDLVVTDLNNDTRKDLVALTSDGKIVVKLGNGTGFDASKTLTLDYTPYRFTSVRFDNDGYDDLVVASISLDSFVVYHGVGDGTFTEAKRVSAPGISQIAAADFDGDGRVDVAYGNLYGPTVNVAFQNADGTFGTPVVLQSGVTSAPDGYRDFPSALVTGDIDEDGKPDLVVANWEEYGPAACVAVFRNNGSRAFTRSTMIPRSWNASGDFDTLLLTDVNGDGHLDIVAGSVNGSTVMTFMGNGDGTFLSPTYYDKQDHFFSVAIGAFSSDGSKGLAAGLYQRFVAARYSCATQVYLFSDSPVISVGQSAPLRVLVSGFGASTAQPRGTVTFREGATQLGSADVDQTGYASLDVSGLALGDHTITADFSGNATVPAGTSSSFTQKVTSYTTTTTIVLPASPSVYGVPFTFNVNIFSTYYNNTTLQWYTLMADGVSSKLYSSNAVTLKLTGGSHTLNATFAGDAISPPSSSGNVQVTTAKATAAISAPTGSLTVRLGTAHSLQFVIQGPAGYAGPTGTLTMTENGSVITSGTVSNGGGVQDSGSATLSATLQRGAHDVIVSYSGDGNFNPATLAVTLTVLPNVPLAIEARGLQNAISIRTVLPANTTSMALYRSPYAANTWTLVNGWTPDVELDSGVPTRGALYDYRLTVIASGATLTSNVDSAMLFTDDPVVSGTVAIKRAHFDELRLAVNALRATAGLAAFDFDSSYSAAFVRASHLLSLRAALTEARQALGMVAPVFTNAVTSGTPIRAVDVQELRNQAR
jgi:hypothetical protein